MTTYCATKNVLTAKLNHYIRIGIVITIIPTIIIYGWAVKLNSLPAFNSSDMAPSSFFSTMLPLEALHSSLIIIVAVVVVFHLWHLKMSIECTVPKTYDNLADDWLTRIGCSPSLSSLLHYVVVTNLYLLKTIHTLSRWKRGLSRSAALAALDLRLLRKLYGGYFDTFFLQSIPFCILAQFTLCTLLYRGKRKVVGLKSRLWSPKSRPTSLKSRNNERF